MATSEALQRKLAQSVATRPWRVLQPLELVPVNLGTALAVHRHTLRKMVRLRLQMLLTMPLRAQGYAPVRCCSDVDTRTWISTSEERRASRGSTAFFT